MTENLTPGVRYCIIISPQSTPGFHPLQALVMACNDVVGQPVRAEVCPCILRTSALISFAFCMAQQPLLLMSHLLYVKNNDPSVSYSLVIRSLTQHILCLLKCRARPSVPATCFRTSVTAAIITAPVQSGYILVPGPGQVMHTMQYNAQTYYARRTDNQAAAALPCPPSRYYRPRSPSLESVPVIPTLEGSERSYRTQHPQQPRVETARTHQSGPRQTYQYGFPDAPQRVADWVSEQRTLSAGTAHSKPSRSSHGGSQQQKHRETKGKPRRSEYQG
ncbi:hypothetical protein BC835DRAFT_1371824 [Cytidiella melzeri]|nr:hypothetical protein BC835DRAFT_1371824 [Cytidiella melzeri]